MKPQHHQSTPAEKVLVGDPAPLPSAPPLEAEILARWSTREPVASVLIHCFQHEDYVGHALDGVLSQQTDFPFEVLVNDDASDDGSAEVIRSYACRYPSLIRLFLHEENQYKRQLRPVSFTFPAARGEFVAICEADDYWLDDRKLQIQVDHLRDHPSDVACWHDALVVEGGRVVDTSLRGGRSVPMRIAARDLERCAPGSYMQTLTVCFRNVLRDVPPEHCRITNGDRFIQSRLGEYGSATFLGHIQPACYRRHEGGLWSSRSTQERVAAQLQFNYWLAQYYRRSGRESLAAHFLTRGTRILLQQQRPLRILDLIHLNVVMLRGLKQSAIRSLGAMWGSRRPQRS